MHDVHVDDDVYIEVKEQLSGVFYLHMGSRDWPQVTRLT